MSALLNTVAENLCSFLYVNKLSAYNLQTARKHCEYLHGGTSKIEQCAKKEMSGFFLKYHLYLNTHTLVPVDYKSKNWTGFLPKLIFANDCTNCTVGSK